MLGCRAGKIISPYPRRSAAMTLILSNDDVEKLSTMQECIEVLEDVYIELSAGRGVNRIRSDCLVPVTRKDALYSLKSMDAVIPKLGVGAVRIDFVIATWPKQGTNMRRVKSAFCAKRPICGVGSVILFRERRTIGDPARRHAFSASALAQPMVSASNTSRGQGCEVGRHFWAQVGRPVRSSWRCAPCAELRRSGASVRIVTTARHLRGK